MLSTGCRLVAVLRLASLRVFDCALQNQEARAYRPARLSAAHGQVCVAASL